MNLLYPNELLSGITDGLKALGDHSKLGNIEVIFATPDGESFGFDLVLALDAIANDLYFDERGNWSDANKVTVRTF